MHSKATLAQQALRVLSIMRLCRRYGSALTRLKVTPEFKAFFETNPAGVFNTSTSAEDAAGFWHAVLLTGAKARQAATVTAVQA